MFEAADGGTFVHSRVTIGDVVTEVFERVDARRAPTFVEITRQRDGARARTRINIEGHTLTARTRSSVAGIIQQTLEVPEAIAFASPAAAADGLRLAGVKSGEVYKATCYVSPGDFGSAAGVLSAVSVEGKGDESVRVPAGEFSARHFVRKSGQGASHLWLHPQLGVPVRGEAGGLQFVLTSLELTPPAK